MLNPQKLVQNDITRNVRLNMFSVWVKSTCTTSGCVLYTTPSSHTWVGTTTHTHTHARVRACTHPHARACVHTHTHTHLKNECLLNLSNVTATYTKTSPFSGFWPYVTTQISFQPLVTNSSTSGRDHMTGKSVAQLSSYCADHSQLSQTLSLIKWHWLLSCFM